MPLPVPPLPGEVREEITSRVIKRSDAMSSASFRMFCDVSAPSASIAAMRAELAQVQHG